MATNLSPLFFWVEWVRKIVWDSFGWVVLILIIFFVPFLRVWWWALTTLILSVKLSELYLWWIGWDFAYAKVKWLVLEIVPPKEVLIPLKAMEDVFGVIWTIGDSANWRDRWIDGELGDAPFWASWEIVSIEGVVHFFLRLQAAHRTTIETALYGYFPEIEIKEVQDYTKLVPQNIPNEEWDMYGEDWSLAKPAAYPIRTYEKFFEPQGERIAAEEKRIDPMASLLEMLSKLGPGEHYWVQIIMMPVGDKDEPTWKKDGEKIVAKISKRPEKKEPTLWEDLVYMLSQVILGPQKEGSGDSAKYSWAEQTKTESNERELLLTPGEREILTEVENKLRKPVFRTAIRGVYVAKRENWKAAHRILSRAYFGPHFAANNMNRMSLVLETRPKINYIMRKRRAFLRARRMFRNSILRFPPGFPDRKKYCAILDTEEMATLFHFPFKVTGLVAPSMSRVESKKGGPPPNLPVG